MAETIGVDYGELNHEINNIRGSANNLSPMAYGSAIGADQFERLVELHNEVVDLTNIFATVIFRDLVAIQKIGANIVDTDGEMSRALTGLMGFPEGG